MLDDKGLIKRDLIRMLTDPEFIIRFCICMAVILLIIFIIAKFIKK